jgi:hypothetical protein
MWTVLLVVVAIPAVVLAIGYQVMIDLKPRRTPSTTNPRDIAALQHRLMHHVRALGDAIGERHLARPHALHAAAEYIRSEWTRQGLSVSDERFDVAGQSVVNLIVERKGSQRPESIVLIGAHYDTAFGTPGANDNGTGVALLLEMTRTLKDEASFPHTVRYVAFVNEESPHFSTDRMGSRVHARRARARGENIVAMLSLETVGYYSGAARSQEYPFPFGLFYPRTGNFLAVVGNLRSRGLVRDFLRHFRAASEFPVEGVATFEAIPGIDWSDHSSFWREGYQAIMLTDTAPFRYPEYHGSGDRSDRIAAPEFARAADGIIRAVRALAAAPEE